MNQNEENEKSLRKAGSVLEESTSLNFDELFNQDDKEVDKKIKYHNNRKGKEVQLLARINQIQMRISKAQTDYRKSLVDPTKDSIELAIEIKALGEEQKIAEGVYRQLFPLSVLATS